MKVYELITCRLWVDDSGWSHTWEEGRYIEINSLSDLDTVDWDWYLFSEPHDPSQDVQIEMAYYLSEVNFLSDDSPVPICVHTIWESELRSMCEVEE